MSVPLQRMSVSVQLSSSERRDALATAIGMMTNKSIYKNWKSPRLDANEYSYIISAKEDDLS